MTRSRKNRPTIVTVANQAGVSPTAVSQALRDTGRLSKATRTRIIKVAKELNYVYDRRAAAFRTGQSQEIGLLIHNIANPFYAEVTIGVNSHLESLGYLVYLLDAQDDLDRQLRFLHSIREGGAAGLMWCPAYGTDDETVAWVQESGIPTVSMLRPIEGHPFDHVGVDNFSGSRLATGRLIELGHRHVAFVGGRKESRVRQHQYGGYASALSLAGLAANPAFDIPCAADKGAAAEATERLVRTAPEITAIVGYNDPVAFGAMLGLQREGLVPGKDVSVTGFDDVSEAAHWTPSLTSVSVNARRIGAELADTLLRRKEDPDSGVRSINLPVALIERESTGPAPESAR